MFSVARSFTAVLTFVSVVLLLQERNSDSDRALIGVVTRVTADSITVLNDQTDPAGLVLSLQAIVRADGAYPARIETGSRIAVWYKSVGDPRPIARRIVVVRTEH